MPPLPTIPDVFRVTWNFATSGGVSPAIVHHFGAASGTDAEIGEAIWASTVDGVFYPMHQNYEPPSLTVLRLDGLSAGVVVANPNLSDSNLCQATGDLLPAVSAVMSFATGIRGPRGRGRSYIGPITEQNSDQGYLAESAGTALVDAWNDWLGALGAGSPSIELGVASYVHETWRPVSSLRVRGKLGTQRRRQDSV